MQMYIVREQLKAKKRDLEGDINKSRGTFGEIANQVEEEEPDI